MRDWPAGKLRHLSQNFFIETLAWLVRSALVRRLAAESGVKPAPAISPSSSAIVASGRQARARLPK
jgi:hypothetical protein